MDRKRHEMQQTKTEEFQQKKFHPILVLAHASKKPTKQTKTWHILKYIEKHEQVKIEFSYSKNWKMKFHQSLLHMSENIAPNL